MNKIHILLVSIFVLWSSNLFSQTDNELWVKLSPEIRMNIQDSPLEFRWRPVDVTFLPEKYVPSGRSARTDLMLGVNVKKFKVFSYSKFSEEGDIWTGVRLDYNFDLLNKKLLLNIQERYFWGINGASDHYYLVQYIRYKIGNNLTTGVLSYGKWKTEKEFNKGNWFIGPSVAYRLPKNFSLLAALAKDIFHEPVYMFFARVGYRIKIKK